MKLEYDLFLDLNCLFTETNIGVLEEEPSIKIIINMNNICYVSDIVFIADSVSALRELMQKGLSTKEKIWC